MMTLSNGNPGGLNVYPNLRDHYCPSGSYCPAGATSLLACPPGTYNSLKGRKSILDCQQTDQGFYTASSNASAVDGPCNAGYYCPLGSSSATQSPCPQGTFRSITAGSKPEDCSICTSGYYCPTPGTASPIICPLGYYCPLGTV